MNNESLCLINTTSHNGRYAQCLKFFISYNLQADILGLSNEKSVKLFFYKQIFRTNLSF